jgi:hypothetical protein
MPIKREIIYPIFLECCHFATDIFWENIFEDLAYGKTPYGTYISKDFLCCSFKKKEFSYKIEKKDVKQIHDDIYKLFTTKLGLLSQKEKSKKKKVFNETEDIIKDSRKSWSDIRKKNLKELFVELYVTRMKNRYSLTMKQARYLFSVIMLSLTLKVINASDIEYVNGYITNIEGIEFEKRKIIIKKDLYNLDVGSYNSVNTGKKLMFDTWLKYLKELNKSERTDT